GARPQAGEDAADIGGRQRDEIRIAPHEAHEADIGYDRDRVSDQKRAAAGGPSRPMEHSASVEVAAALDERHAGCELTRPPPCDDRGVVALHPLAIGDRDVYRRSTERVAPLDHRTVEMRWPQARAA